MVYKFCPQCKTSSNVSAKKCKKCQEPLGAKYRVVTQDKGVRYTRVVDSLKMAQDIDKITKTDMLRGEFVIADHQKKKVVTLNDIWVQHLPNIQAVNKAWKDDFLNYNRHIKPVFGDMPLKEITYSRIVKFQRSFDKKLSIRGRSFEPATVKHQLVLLRRLFNVAIKSKKYIGTNPVSEIDMPVVDNEVIRVLTDEQFAELQRILDLWPIKQSAAIIRFLIYTGCRRGEAFSLKWSDVDFDRKMITFTKPKGRKTTTIPVNDVVIGILNNIERKQSEHVFPGKLGGRLTDISCWKRISKMAKLPKEFRLHDLRHHFASCLISNGIDISVISKLLTHKNIATTMKYSHLSNVAMKAGADKAEELFNPKLTEIIQLKHG